ncbi:MAG: efflux RND transporter periplasmic adaptor subunit, partial [Candidatus Binataceae bacterium]
TALLALATLSPLRIYADVPQSVAPFVKDGDPATITVTEYPGRVFEGNVTRHPEALTAATRTMLVEVDLTNDDRALLPGMYARLNLRATVPEGPPLVPDDALVFRDGKPYVPLVRDNRLRLAEVTLGYDDGINVEVTRGVAPQDLVAINVGQAARDGELVRPMTAAQAQ